MLSRRASRKIMFGAMRKHTVHGLAEHAPRDKGKEGRFSEAMSIGEFLISFGNSDLIQCVRMQYLNFPRQTLSTSRKGKNYIYCHLTAIFVPVSHVVYRHTP